MRKTILLLSAVAIAAADLSAQANSRGTGYDGALIGVSAARAWGRRGATYPGGEVGVSFQNDLCNPGTMNLEWRAPMLEDHPKFSFVVCKEVNGRFLQISNWSYIKHAFLSLNASGPCGTCQQPPAGGAQMGPHCSDTYANSNNGDRNYLGPPEELDPWLGTWNHIGSYFDRGDPDVGSPGNHDGARSTISVAGDAVKNRVTIKEADLVGVTTGLYFQIQVVHEGEPASNRANNLMSRPFGMSWNGTAWTASTSGTATTGSILTRWSGATQNIGGNGNDDGRFIVAVKVTGPTNGRWHYEYAVHNVDNSRGGAGFHVPVCPAAQVTNLGFRDIDQDSLNQWTASVAGGEIVWSAPATNPQNWNQIFNFWFDSDAAPVAGSVNIDEARIGAGALQVNVASTVPGFLPNIVMGAGCGAPAVTVSGNGTPSIPNASFALNIATSPNTGMFAFYSFGPASIDLGNGCTQYLDPLANTGTHGFLLSDAGGLASIPLSIPATLTPIDIYWQVASLQSGGPAFGEYNLSNGLRVRVGATTGCQ